MEFYWLIINHFIRYSLMAITIFLIYIIVLKKYIYSIFDPFLFENIISSCFATTTVLFLFSCNSFNLIYLINYIITLFVYWGIFIAHAKKIKKKFYINKNNPHLYQIEEEIALPNYLFILFFFLSLINIFYQLYIYISFGIPLFMESRLTINMQGGVVNGFFARLQLLISNMTVFISFFILAYYKGYRQLYAKFYMLLLVLFAFLSGSRAALFLYIFVFSAFVYLNQKSWKKGLKIFLSKTIYKVLILLIISGLLVIVIQNSSKMTETFIHLFLRFASYGDAYAYAYPNDNILAVEKPSFLQFLFGDILSTFRINIVDRVTVGYGYELKAIAEGVENVVTGPNPRMNVVGYSYFGFIGNIILSAICGVIFTYVRNYFVQSVDKGIERKIFSYYIYIMFRSIESDILAIIVNVTTNLILQSGLVLFLIFILKYSKKRKACICV